MDKFNKLNELLIQMSDTLLEIRNLLVAKQLGIQTERRWLDKQEVLELLHISDRSLFTLRKEGKVKVHTIRGKIYYDRDDIQRILKRPPAEM